MTFRWFGGGGWNFTLCIVYWYLVQFFNTLYLQQYLCIFYEVIKWITLLTSFMPHIVFKFASDVSETTRANAWFLKVTSQHQMPEVFFFSKKPRLRMRLNQSICWHSSADVATVPTAEPWWWEWNNCVRRVTRKWQVATVNLYTLLCKFNTQRLLLKACSIS